VVCDLTQKQETPKQAHDRVTKALQALAAGLQGNKVSLEIGPQGAISFRGWAAGERGGLSDTCAYRLMKQQHGFALSRAIAMAEMKSGRKVSIGQIDAGTHSHDGGKTWHPGH
jgi:hypothetical protein